MQELMPTQLWLRPRMQSCDQYGRILLASGVISEKSPQRSASFLVRCRFGVARGRLWREAVVRGMRGYEMGGRRIGDLVENTCGATQLRAIFTRSAVIGSTR